MTARLVLRDESNIVKFDSSTDTLATEYQVVTDLVWTAGVIGTTVKGLRYSSEQRVYTAPLDWVNPQQFLAVDNRTTVGYGRLIFLVESNVAPPSTVTIYRLEH